MESAVVGVPGQRGDHLSNFINFLSGIILLWTEPFRIGDQIAVGEFEGTVEDIQTRATVLRTFDERRVVIPNAELFTGSVVVNTVFKVRRVEHEIGIGYGDDIRTATRLIMEAIDATAGILEDPRPDVIVVELADFSVTLRVRWWVEWSSIPLFTIFPAVGPAVSRIPGRGLAHWLGIRRKCNQVFRRLYGASGQCLGHAVSPIDDLGPGSPRSADEVSDPRS